MNRKYIVLRRHSSLVPEAGALGARGGFGEAAFGPESLEIEEAELTMAQLEQREADFAGFGSVSN